MNDDDDRGDDDGIGDNDDDDDDDIDDDLYLPGIFNGNLISKGCSYLPFRTMLSS